MERYQLIDTLYANPIAGVSVHKAVEKTSGLTVCIKKMIIESEDMLVTMQQEAANLELYQHTGICTLFDSFVAEESEGRAFVLVMELLIADLSKEAEKRRANFLYWSEEEIWMMLEEITEALAYLQTHGFAHRDVKPQNIFLTSQGHIKLGDFGCSRFTPLDLSITIQGTPLYLSPKLRNAYAKMLAEPMLVMTRHNVYKSDVFSLGITMMQLAVLEAPHGLAGTKGLEGKINAAIAGVNMYSGEFRSVLKIMMETKEKNRPDFIELLQIVKEHRRKHTHLPEIHCGNCSRRIQAANFALVSLPCAPQTHCFCSKDCFCLFTTSQESANQTPSCPQCQAPIPAELITSLRSQREAESQERLHSICSECKRSGQLMEVTQCSHRFCLDCVKFWKAKYVTKPSGCPKCGRPLKAEAIRWMKGGCRLL